jgi:hypothetical protein
MLCHDCPKLFWSDGTPKPTYWKPRAECCSEPPPGGVYASEHPAPQADVYASDGLNRAQRRRQAKLARRNR